METEIATAAEATTLLYRLIGSVGGAIIAVAVVQPWTLNGFLRRLAVSVASGVMLSPIFIEYVGWEYSRDRMIAAACIVSAVAWWVWHAVIRGVQAGWIPGLPKRGKADE